MHTETHFEIRSGDKVLMKSARLEPLMQILQQGLPESLDGWTVFKVVTKTETEEYPVTVQYKVIME